MAGKHAASELPITRNTIVEFVFCGELFIGIVMAPRDSYAEIMSMGDHFSIPYVDMRAKV